MKKKILITGASGFLGTWLAEKVFNSGYLLIGVDLREPQNPNIWYKFAIRSCENIVWESFIEENSLYAICHLAGGASVDASVRNPYGDFSSLLPGTAKLADYLIKFQPKARTYLFSSAAVYGNPTNLPITETSETIPISPYGIHKYLAESLLIGYSRILGLNVTIFRIFSIYGPGLTKQLVWDVAKKAFSAARNGEDTIRLFGTGNETRDFIYVEDLCNAVILFLEKDSDKKLELYNIASGIETTVKDLATCLVNNLKISIKIEFDNNQPKGNPINWRADIKRLNETGFVPIYSLNDGLKKVAEWFISSNSI